MKITDIKRTMKAWYESYDERHDESYIELYNSFRTLKNAGLISSETWKKIFDYDDKLFQEFSK